MKQKKDKLEKYTKHDLIDMIHQAKCMKLKNAKNVDAMTKEELVNLLVKSKCPVIAKLLKLKA